MDDRTFDDLSRIVGATSSRRAALAAAAALAAGGAMSDAAGKRRRRCRPACPPEQTCVRGECACDNGGAVCGAACCTGGQTCQGGTCVEPPPPCVGFGATCKNVGVPCCDGFVCGSGQGGEGDVACYVPAGGPCATTAACVFDSACTDGICVATPRPTPTPAPSCASTFPATADAVANGAALRAALLAADPNVPTEIVLAGGEYAMPNFGWTFAQSLTIRACPGETVVWTPDATYDRNQTFFNVRGATVVLERIVVAGNGVASSGTGVELGRGGRGDLTLRQCTVRDFSVGVEAMKQLTMRVVGGDYASNATSFRSEDSLSGEVTFTCTDSPRAAHCCLNEPAEIAACGCTSNCP